VSRNTKGAENGVGDGFGTLFVFRRLLWYGGCILKRIDRGLQ